MIIKKKKKKERERGFVLLWTKANELQLIHLLWLCHFRVTVFKLCLSDCRLVLTSFLPRRWFSCKCM